MIMSSHPLYPRLEPRPRTPATFSKKLITGLLREELGFRGAIASDDLEMSCVGWPPSAAPPSWRPPPGTI